MDKQATQEAEAFFRLVTTGSETEAGRGDDHQNRQTTSNVVDLAEYRRRGRSPVRGIT
jgi:hypothetical protein